MATEEQIKEAKPLGWAPREQWRGPPEHWVDADVFLEKGRTVLPILKQNNDRLTQTVSSQQTEIDRLKNLVEAGQASMEEFKKFHGEELKRQVDKTKRELRVGIEAARKDGDTETVVELQEKLDDLTESTRTLKPEPEKPNVAPSPAPNQPHPDFTAWQAENSWYGQDPVKTSLMNGVAFKLRKEGSELTGRAFFEAVAGEVEQTLNPPGRGPSKVESGGVNGGGAGGGSSKFDSLPNEARAYARSVAKKYAGEGKMFKTEQAWLDFYAEQYEV